MSSEKIEEKKRRGTSLPLLIGFLILGIVGYYSGPSIMTYAFYLQENYVAATRPLGVDLPSDAARDSSGDPGVSAGASSDAPAVDGEPAATGNATTPPSDTASAPTDATP